MAPSYFQTKSLQNPKKIKIKIAQSGKQKVCILKINAYYRVVAVKNT